MCVDVNRIVADRLDLLQGRENEGRGISCVRYLIAELRRENRSAAAAIANNEWDKISSYPRVAEEIKMLGLVSADSYITKQ